MEVIYQFNFRRAPENEPVISIGKLSDAKLKKSQTLDNAKGGQQHRQEKQPELPGSKSTLPIAPKAAQPSASSLIQPPKAKQEQKHKNIAQPKKSNNKGKQAAGEPSQNPPPPSSSGPRDLPFDPHAQPMPMDLGFHGPGLPRFDGDELEEREELERIHAAMMEHLAADYPPPLYPPIAHGSAIPEFLREAAYGTGMMPQVRIVIKM